MITSLSEVAHRQNINSHVDHLKKCLAVTWTKYSINLKKQYAVSFESFFTEKSWIISVGMRNIIIQEWNQLCFTKQIRTVIWTKNMENSKCCLYFLWSENWNKSDVNDNFSENIENFLEFYHVSPLHSKFCIQQFGLWCNIGADNHFFHCKIAFFHKFKFLQLEFWHLELLHTIQALL